MALQRTNIGTTDDGRPLVHYSSDAGKPLVYTGPHIAAHVELPDGTVYDCTDLFTEVEHEEHAAHLACAVGRHFVANGHPAHGDPAHPDHVPFAHSCDLCPEA